MERTARGVIALVVLAACAHEETPDRPEPDETWWERPDMGWWWKGGKDPKEAELVTCEELAPGFVTLRVSELRDLELSRLHRRVRCAAQLGELVAESAPPEAALTHAGVLRL